MDQAVTDYLISRHCSKQWLGFMTALCDEFAEQLGEAELRELMARIGARFASTHPVKECSTLEELELTISQVWFDIDWGWTELIEESGALHIRHHAVPLFLATSPQALAWTGGFLEGVYQGWFSTLGLADGLSVKQSTVPDASGTVDLVLSR